MIRFTDSEKKKAEIIPLLLKISEYKNARCSDEKNCPLAQCLWKYLLEIYPLFLDQPMYELGSPAIDIKAISNDYKTVKGRRNASIFFIGPQSY